MIVVEEDKVSEWCQAFTNLFSLVAVSKGVHAFFVWVRKIFGNECSKSQGLKNSRVNGIVRVKKVDIVIQSLFWCSTWWSISWDQHVACVFFLIHGHLKIGTSLYKYTMYWIYGISVYLVRTQEGNTLAISIYLQPWRYIKADMTYDSIKLRYSNLTAADEHPLYKWQYLSRQQLQAASR